MPIPQCLHHTLVIVQMNVAPQRRTDLGALLWRVGNAAPASVPESKLTRQWPDNRKPTAIV